jgi:hypothetical protein
MKKVNWEMIGALAGIASLIVTVLIAFSLSVLGKWTPAGIALVVGFGFLVIVVNKRKSIIKALKPRPRLGITVRDISVYVVKVTVSEEKRVRGELQTGRHDVLRGNVRCTVRIKNKSRAKATNIHGLIELTFEKTDDALSLTTATQVGFNLAGKQEIPLIIRLTLKELLEFQEKFELYPDSPFRLEYSYTCDELAKIPIAKATGRLTKADWTGSVEDLKELRETGYYT